jgi:hypothetical protein
MIKIFRIRANPQFEVQMNHFRNFLMLLMAWSLSTALHAREIQLDCKFTSSTKLTKMDPINPKFETEKLSTEYLFFVDEKTKNASYINLKYKIKSPLVVVHSSTSMITFVEKVENADNHFSISIFTKADANGALPAVMFSHSWNPSISFYSPETVLGTCRRQ